jgi:hypothetical protein
METLNKTTKATISERTNSILNRLDKLENAIEKSKNTYSNENGIEKQGCRFKIEHKITTSNVYGTILTLPHIACLIEKMILAKSKSFNFIGVERDDKTFTEMKKTIKKDKLAILPYKGNISDKIYGMERESYAHLILDYCGLLTTISKEIQYTLHNKLVPIGGTIHITFAKIFRGQRHIHDKVRTNTIVTNGNKDERCESEVAIRTFFDKVCGFDYDLEEIYYYKDKGRTPMVLVQIKRIA